MGIIDKIKSMFKPKQEEEQVIRVGRTREEKEIQEENEPLYLRARKWREQKAQEEPLIKRGEYKKKY